MKDADEMKEWWLEALGPAGERASYRLLAPLIESPELRALAAGEPPRGVDEPAGVSRRALLKLLGASMALAGVAGCTPHEPEKILPYNETPPGVVPGLSQSYATSMVLDGYAMGLLAKSYAGRPIKIEGNPAHPASLGATGVHEQASILSLYDPYRARAPTRGGQVASWEAFSARFGGDREDGGAGLRFVLQPTSSPLIAALIERVRRRFPGARFTFWSPVHAEHALEGARAALGLRLLPQLDVDQAEVILALDADFLADMPFSVRYARDFASRRRPASPAAAMSRLYVAEAMFTPTGTLADHRLRVRPAEVARVAAGVAAELVHGLGLRPRGITDADAAALRALRPPDGEGHGAFVRALARDLARARGAGVAVVGDGQPPIVHALGHVINAALRSRAAWMVDPVLIDAGPSTQSFSELVGELGRGAVDTLILLDVNPVYAAPADVDFAGLLARVPTSLKAGLYDDETARACTWFVPTRHYLESWGDARAYDGTVSFVQPLVRPLFDGRAVPELLAVFAGDERPDPRLLLREHWRGERGEADFEAFWGEALKRGFLPDSARPRQTPDLAPADLAQELARLAAAPRPAGGALDVAFLRSPSLHDGRFANNPWLQELPRPITRLTWGNAAMMSAATAARLGVERGDVVELALRGRTIEIPAVVVRGHADDVISVDLGYGRDAGEEVARGVGVSAYRIRPSDARWFAGGLSVRKTGATAALALAQLELSQHDRPIALRRTLPQYREQPGFAEEHKGPVRSILPEVEYTGAQWAMSIDMSICTGCSSCVVACQAENNVLVVGKEEVMHGREMQWLRIDQYFEGGGDEVSVVNQPMLCQHCEKAPCEYVCPVNATVHSPDGLNEMIYNRCIGTRFCSNNCPYKIRRFNFFDYNAHVPYNAGLRRLQRNPDVTVRARGVMEKCTYCVQRIREADIRAQIERRPLRPGEVVTACQQACPTGAIQFGSLDHADTKMVAWRREPRAYAVLHDLGTRPRTEYLAKIENPNPGFGAEGAERRPGAPNVKPALGAEGAERRPGAPNVKPEIE
ncbi:MULTISPECIES: 4Fe-4S dicluster domain-containing protein [Sorangium]|uniref:4Fe-4S dicluster domain-containing protein n=1 Tax=Sorangium TaxID=39643 RepID=UPI001F2D7F7C|nr:MULTISPECIES: 4Fe-4S dicluster domain-containing protein [Sorangium]